MGRIKQAYQQCKNLQIIQRLDWCIECAPEEIVGYVAAAKSEKAADIAGRHDISSQETLMGQRLAKVLSPLVLTGRGGSIGKESVGDAA